MTKVEIISNEYLNKKRMCTQIVTYSKSEDLQLLADIQRRFENVENEIERETDNLVRLRLHALLDEITTELVLQQKNVEGYEKSQNLED